MTSITVAVDNATGTGRHHGDGARPFLWCEQHAPLGAGRGRDGRGNRVFLARPGLPPTRPCPLNSIVGGLNIDAELPLGRRRAVVVVGYGGTELEDILREEARCPGPLSHPRSEPLRPGISYSSDHVRSGLGGRGVAHDLCRWAARCTESTGVKKYVDARRLAYRVNRFITSPA